MADLILTERVQAPAVEPEPEFWPTLAAVAYLAAHDLASAPDDGEAA